GGGGKAPASPPARCADRGPRSGNAFGVHSTIRAQAHRGGRVRAGPVIRVRRAAPSFGHPRGTARCPWGSPKLRADATGSWKRFRQGPTARAPGGFPVPGELVTPPPASGHVPRRGGAVRPP